MPLGCVSQKCNWRRLSGLCDRPRLSVGVRAVRCGCYLVLNLLRIPCAVYTVYGQRSIALACMDWRAVRRSSAWTRPCERQKKGSRSWQIRTVSVQSVATILVLLAFSGSYITALAAVAWQVHHAAMSWSFLVLLQLTVLICLLSFCASETNSLRDSRCFLLLCQAPTSSRRCCCSIHAYIHTHIHTDRHIHTYIQTYIHAYIHTYIHTYMHACMHAYIHTYMHTQLTHTGLYVDVIAKELALSEATWCYWISVFSVVYLAGLRFGCKSITRT